MTRVGRLTTVIVLMVVVALFCAVGLLRASRSAFSAPSELKPDMAQVMAGHVFSFAARVGHHVILFDAGQDPAGHAEIAMLSTLHATSTDVRHIFLTHGNWDHVAAAGLFTQARIWAGAGDVALAAHLVPPEALLTRVLGYILPTPPVQVTQPLEAAMDIEVGEDRIVRALPMGGHTAGSYAYLYDGVLFVGDNMYFHEGKLGPPLEVFNAHPEANRQAVLSLRPALTNLAIDRVCTAHGGCTPATQGRALLDAYLNTLTSPPGT